MKKTLLSLTALSAVLTAVAADADPVLMNVAGKDVRLSEFEYLYLKNNEQQLSVQPIDEYLDSFIIYKLKVADAEAAGLENADSFRQEYEGYIRDLSEPYMSDESVRDSLINALYERRKRLVDVSHIMVPVAPLAQEEQAKQALRNLRDRIVAGELDFAAVADSISIDPAVKRNHGHMGWMTAGVYPYTFEDVAFSTPVGEISDVVETPFGYHIIRVEAERPNPGKVRARHILKNAFRLTPEKDAEVKAVIDSLYNLIATGQATFEDIARTESQDPGSAANGGDLGFFSAGDMIAPFQDAVYELADGELHTPIQTPYGYHIIQRLETRPMATLEELRPQIERSFARDDRSKLPHQARVRQLCGKYGVAPVDATVDAVKNAVTAAGGMDSVMVNSLRKDSRKIVSAAKSAHNATVADAFGTLPELREALPVENAFHWIDNRLAEVVGDVAVAAERDNLANERPDYRNLLNEYRDGMLLFEISDRNVWAKSKTDTEGLDAFFIANRDKYCNWKSPKFKGFVIFATSDSIGADASAFLAANPVSRDSLVDTMRGKYGKEVKVERVLAAQGENEIIDGIAFGGPHQPASGKWKTYFAYDESIIEQPEEVADARGAVTADYQDKLEQEWVKQLRKRYKVKLNKKVFEAYKSSVSSK